MPGGPCRPIRASHLSHALCVQLLVRYALSTDMNETISLPFDHVKAHTHLSGLDKRLAKLIVKTGAFHFKLDTCDSVYESLLEAITHQSISGKAARTIFARINALGTEGRCPTPGQILATSDLALREAGLSYAKAAAMKDLAQKTMEGIVPTLEEAHALSDEELVARLISVKGIGAWTVEMFLIFRLGRPDVLPIHDYGVQKGFALTYGKKVIPKPRELAAFGERWRPYRSVASWYMWRAVELYGKTRKVAKATSAKKKRKKAGKSKAKKTIRKTKVERKKVGAAKRK
jgi:DNA-3-methyladenine glycosylase II